MSRMRADGPITEKEIDDIARQLAMGAYSKWIDLREKGNQDATAMSGAQLELFVDAIKQGMRGAR